MKRSRIRYNEHIDSSIRHFYSQFTVKMTAKLIRETLGIDISPDQVKHRVKALKLTKRSIGYGRVAPKWIEHPEGFVGPCPHSVNGLQILYFDGTERYKANDRPKHMYICRCIVCGKDDRYPQVSLVARENRDSRGCKNCSTAARNYERKRKRAELDVAAQKAFNEQLWVMHTMPVASK